MDIVNLPMSWANRRKDVAKHLSGACRMPRPLMQIIETWQNIRSGSFIEAELHVTSGSLDGQNSGGSWCIQKQSGPTPKESI